MFPRFARLNASPKYGINLYISSVRLSPSPRSVRIPRKLPATAVSNFSQQTFSRAAQKAIKNLPVGGFRSQVAQEAEIKKRVAQGGGIRLLYQSPGNTGYFTIVYLTSGLCIGYAMLLAHDYCFSPLPAGVHWSVRYAFAISSVFLAALGTFVLCQSANVIRAIEVVPSSTGVRLHAHVRPIVPLPFRRARLFDVRPGDIVLDRSLVAPMSPNVSELPGNVAQQMLRRLSFINFNLFAGARKMFTSEGFIKARIEGSGATFKLDIAGTFDSDRRVLNSMLKFES